MLEVVSVSKQYDAEPLFTGLTLALRDPAGADDREVLASRGVTARADDRHLFAGVDLNVRAGDRVLLTVDNGAGKTTLLRLLVGLRAHRGAVVLVTHDVWFADAVGYDRCWRVADGRVHEERAAAGTPMESARARLTADAHGG
ncbi:ATP-binding cassette domain-containing protein [Micromonospora sp. NPDC057141]|uniref:ATP-binding cassette domain-containing protein n=1 Tax=Micromonospora sp. NPDC057141 TaxID=3346033 RepID=UPI003637E69B